MKKYTSLAIVIVVGIISVGLTYSSGQRLLSEQDSLFQTGQQTKGEVLGWRSFRSNRYDDKRNDRDSQTPTATPTQTLTPTTYPTPYATPRPAPYSTPYATPAYPTPYATPYASPYATPASSTSSYYLHKNITSTVFWVGEPQGGGSSEDNALSAWDDAWELHFGGFDNPNSRIGLLPVGFTPKENPFYLDVPYNDFTDSGNRKSNAAQVVPWASTKTWGSKESMMKNRWVKLIRNGVTCYGQLEDAGPYQYDDTAYVFGIAAPKSKLANNAGLDVSPGLRDCLKFVGLNNSDNKVDWQFIEASDVPAGPWKQVVTTSQIYWP